MKLLFDQNISYRISKKLIDFPITSLHVSECDLYDLAILKGHPPKVIWLRTGNLTTSKIVEIILKNQALITEFLISPIFEKMSCLEIGS